MTIQERWNSEKTSAEQFSIRFSERMTEIIYQLKDKYPHLSLNRIVNDLVEEGFKSIQL